MEFIYERKINYYETDRMGVVHHSNYIRYLEEARTEWLEVLNMPFDLLEKNKHSPHVGPKKKKAIYPRQPIFC